MPGGMGGMGWDGRDGTGMGGMGWEGWGMGGMGWEGWDQACQTSAETRISAFFIKATENLIPDSDRGENFLSNGIQR